jgi:hypothetical protein
VQFCGPVWQLKLNWQLKVMKIPEIKPFYCPKHDSQRGGITAQKVVEDDGLPLAGPRACVNLNHTLVNLGCVG